MSVDQGGRLAQRAAPKSSGTQRLGALRERYDRATADLDPPLAVVDLGAFDRNAADMTRRAAGRPIRVATKSLRCRYLIERALATPGYRGVMCYSLPEALWLHAMGTSDDLLVAYPTVDRRALRALAADDQARQRITIMTDSEAHLDVVDRVLGDGHPEIRVCLDLDVSWRPLGRRPAVHIGTRRSPLHTPEQAADFAKAITRHAGFRLVGVMGYEGQIAGLGDAPPGHPVRAQLIRLIQGRSVPELNRRRTETIRLIQALTDPGIRERRRHRQPGIDRAGRVGDRAHGRFRAGRTDPVRCLPPVHPRARPALCAAGGEKARPGYRHAVLRRLRRLRRRYPGPAAAAVPARGPQPHRRRGRRRGPDAGTRRGRREPAARRPGSGCATPRPANSPSGSGSTT